MTRGWWHPIRGVARALRWPLVGLGIALTPEGLSYPVAAVGVAMLLPIGGGGAGPTGRGKATARALKWPVMGLGVALSSVGLGYSVVAMSDLASAFTTGSRYESEGPLPLTPPGRPVD